MAAETILVTLSGALPVLLAVLALLPVRDREVTAFSVQYSLGSPSSRLLRIAIARSRGMRLLGAAVGLSLPVVARAATHDALPTGSAPLWGAAGYLAGALLAAMVPTARPDGRSRVASLTPRRASDYLPRRALALPGITVVLSLLAAAAYFVVPLRPEAASGTLLGAVALCVVAAVAEVLAIWMVVSRPQPVVDDEVLAVDDAVRAHGLQLVVGTGITIGALAAAVATFELGRATSVNSLGLACIVIGLAEAVLARRAFAGRWSTGRVQRPA